MRPKINEVGPRESVRDTETEANEERLYCSERIADIIRICWQTDNTARPKM